MHQLAETYSGKKAAVRTISKLVETEFIHQIDITSVSKELRPLLQRGAACEVSLDPSLPAGLCHMDYDEQNMLCAGNLITAVLDFDDMAVAPYAVCLAYTLWHIQDTQGITAIDKYLQQYTSIRQLSDAERRFLPSAMLFRHYVITAIKILNGEVSPAHTASYLQTEEYIRSLAW